MEMMSRDKWLVLDIGSERSVEAISLRGLVDSFAPARVRVETGETADGPWDHVRQCRAFGAPLRWQQFDLRGHGGGGAPIAGRYFRLHVRREGHATFRHAVHGVLFHCEPTAEELEEAAKQAKKQNKRRRK